MNELCFFLSGALVGWLICRVQWREQEKELSKGLDKIEQILRQDDIDQLKPLHKPKKS